MRGPTAFCPMVLAALFLSSPAGATPLRLTMDDAVGRALTVSPDLRSNQAEFESANANLALSAAVLPSAPFLSAGVLPEIKDGSGSGYSVSISQEFEGGGQREKRMEIARHGVDRARLRGKTTKRTLIANVKVAFVSALGARDRRELTQGELEAAQSFARALGEAPPDSELGRIERNIAATQVSRAKRDLAAADQGVNDALSLLRYYLFVRQTREIEVVGSLRDDIREVPPLSELLERALDGRTDLATQRKMVEEAEGEIDLRKREIVPNVTLSTSISRFEGDTFAGFDVGLYLPVLGTGAVRADRALAERNRAQADLDDTQRIIEWEVTRAYHRYRTGADALTVVREEIVPRGEENLRLEQQLYDRAEVGVAELIGLQVDLISARRELLDALIEFNEALIELEQAVGGPLS